MPEYETKRKMLKIYNMTETEAEEFAKSIKMPRLHTYRYSYWFFFFGGGGGVGTVLRRIRKTQGL